MTMPHQVVTRAIGGTVAVVTIRDPADGTERYVVTYRTRNLRPWLSRHRFHDLAQAEAGCLALADFLGAEYRA